MSKSDRKCENFSRFSFVQPLETSFERENKYVIFTLKAPPLGHDGSKQMAFSASLSAL
jgi:hypothetical protein